MKTLISYTDTIRNCECCGRTNLKGTYLLVDEYDNESYFGSECAIKALETDKGTFKKISNIDEIIKSAVSEAFDMGVAAFDENIQKVILRRKLRLSISNPYYNKETQSQF